MGWIQWPKHPFKPYIPYCPLTCSWDQHLCQLVNVGHGSQAKLLWEIYFLNVVLENYNTDYHEC